MTFRNFKMSLIISTASLATFLVPSTLFAYEGEAKSSLRVITIDRKAPTYMEAGKKKLKSYLPPSAYREYAKKGKWSKVKNAKKSFVWVSGAKAVTPTKSLRFNELENEIVQLVNEERKKRKIAPLKKDMLLKTMTVIRTNDMVKMNYFSHKSPLYGRWANFLYTNEYQFSFAGENVAAGFITAKGFVNAWMGSKTHRENILNKRFDKIGITVLDGTEKNHYITYATQWFSQ